MINLIVNEFIKVFKKKTIYILLFITLAYIILSNIILKNTSNNYSNYFYDDTQYFESSLKELDPHDSNEVSQYIDLSVQLEVTKLTKEYGSDSWQSYIINTILPEYIEPIIEHEYTDNITDETYNEAKKSYDIAIEKFKADDWKYFVNQKLDEINSSLEEQYKLKETTKDNQTLTSIEKTIANLEVSKQVNEWRLEKNISYEPSFLNNALENYSSNKTELISYQGTDLSKASKDDLKYYNSALENANLNKYYIDNMITLKSGDNRDMLLNLFGQYELFILIIGIVIAGSIVSDEFNKGTIKLLLVKPYNRIKILFAKFIVCMCVLVLAISFIAISQFIFGGLIQGFSSLSIPAIIYNFDTNKVETMNILSYICLTGICKLPIYILLTTLAFTCSTIFTNTALAVSLPFLGYIAAPFINQLSVAYNIEEIIYFVTPNWDLTQYLFGGTPLFENTTVPFSIIVCLIYLVILIFISSVVFKKRDIKNI